MAGTERDFTTSRFVGPTVLDTAFTTLDRDAEGRAWASLDVPGGATGAALWADPGIRLPHGLHRRHPRARSPAAAGPWPLSR